MMPERLSVILIEGSYLLQSGIQSLLSEFPGMRVTAIFDGSEKHLAEKVLAKKPDVLIIDPNTANLELLSFLREIDANNGMQVIGLISNETPDNVVSRFPHVLNFFECKYDLLESLKAILGKRILSAGKSTNNQNLSEREKTILTEIVLGLTNQEIADKLFLSIHTVTTHRKNLTNKLGIKTVSGLTVYALINKLVDIHDIEHK